jgi:hypothetical protein
MQEYEYQEYVEEDTPAEPQYEEEYHYYEPQFND